MSVDIAAIANNLLSVSGIQRVVSIDDLHRGGADLEEVLAEIDVMEETMIEANISPILSLNTGDNEIVRSTIRSQWEVMAPEVKNALKEGVISRTRGNDEGEKLGNDLRTGSKLPAIFKTQLIPLSYKEWMARKDEVISASMPPTLLLVDLDFTSEGIPGQSGVALIHDLLSAQPEAKIFCALLTNAYALEFVHENWRKLCSDHNLPPERFVLIPKEALYEDESRFLALIKLVVLNGHASQLSEIVRDSYVDSAEEAVKSLGKIDAYEFEQIVCVSSLSEGVWEPDTLARIFAIYHRATVRKAIHANERVYELAAILRTLSRIDTGEWGERTPKAIELRRMEWFDSGDEINDQYSPLELGDIFTVASRPDKRYVLVSQPCDLMVRSSGKRHETVENGILLEASRVTRAEANEFGFLLDFYEASSDWRVNMRKVTTIALEVLDLCVLQQDGTCNLSLKDQIPSRLNAAWSARAPRLHVWARSVLGRYSDLVNKGVKSAEAEKIATSLWMGKFATGRIDDKAERVTYNLQRVGRLRQPRAGALLSRYANAMARQAFEHDLARRDEFKTIIENTEAATSNMKETDSTAETSPVEIAKDIPQG